MMGVVCELVKTLKHRMGNNEYSTGTLIVSTDAKFFNIGAHPSFINLSPVD